MQADSTKIYRCLNKSCQARCGPFQGFCDDCIYLMPPPVRACYGTIRKAAIDGTLSPLAAALASSIIAMWLEWLDVGEHEKKPEEKSHR